VATDVVPGHGVEVVKADWHPLSDSGGHIAVLTSDSLVRIYDVSIDADHAQQTYSLLSKGTAPFLRLCSRGNERKI